MSIEIVRHGKTIAVIPDERLDAFGASELGSVLDDLLEDENLRCIVFEMKRVRYLSSAGLRYIIKTHKVLKSRNGALGLCSIEQYPKKILETAGMLSSLNIFNNCRDAFDYLQGIEWENQALENWFDLESVQFDNCTFRFIPGEARDSKLCITGSIADIMHSKVTASHIYSKLFNESDYSIGVGALGDKVEDYLKLLGGMICVGGMMSWLPTDGNDLADYLIPRNDKGEIKIKTPFNLSLSGGFNEYVVFETGAKGSVSIIDIYKNITQIASRRRRDFKGVIGLCGVVEVDEMYTGSLLRSPIEENAPANGKSILNASNIGRWISRDVAPRYEDVSAILCGFGVDLSMDLKVYDQNSLYNAFYIDPVSVGEEGVILNNHAAVFTKYPLAKKVVALERSVKELVNDGEFLDSRKINDETSLYRGIIGISYIERFEKDSSVRDSEMLLPQQMGLTINSPKASNLAAKKGYDSQQLDKIKEKKDNEINKFQMFLEQQQLKFGSKKGK